MQERPLGIDQLVLWPRGAVTWKMVRARDHWVEYLKCPNCRKTGIALLSDVNEYSLDIQVDAVPEGVEVIHSKHGIELYCASCDIPVES
jgi:hypothetical protein